MSITPRQLVSAIGALDPVGAIKAMRDFEKTGEKPMMSGSCKFNRAASTIAALAEKHPGLVMRIIIEAKFVTVIGHYKMQDLEKRTSWVEVNDAIIDVVHLSVMDVATKLVLVPSGKV
jgi:hypothetical protein